MKKPLKIILLSVALLGCGAKSSYAGRWVNKDTSVSTQLFSGGKAEVTERSLTLNADGTGTLSISVNGEAPQQYSGKWDVAEDILRLDYDTNKTVYYRVIRSTNERLVLRNPEGAERIFDRVQ
jgi:hypothetical protein